MGIYGTMWIWVDHHRMSYESLGLLYRLSTIPTATIYIRTKRIFANPKFFTHYLHCYEVLGRSFCLYWKRSLSALKRSAEQRSEEYASQTTVQ